MDNSVYFDHNIYSYVVRNELNGNYSVSDQIQKLINNNTIRVYYSDQHIFETSKREIISHIDKELEVIHRITCDWFIEPDYQLIRFDPRLRYKFLHSTGIFELFKSVMGWVVEQSSKEEDPKSPLPNNIPSQKMNNLPIKDVLPLIEKQMQDASSKINPSDFSRQFQLPDENKNEIINIFTNFLQLLVGESANSQEIKRKLQQGMDKKLLSVKKQILPLLQQNQFTINEWLKAFNLTDDSTVAALENLIGSFGYYPDKKRVRDKKGPLGEQYDSPHLGYAVHFQYFVTNDKRFAKRSKIVVNELNLSTKLMNLQKFLEYFT